MEFHGRPYTGPIITQATSQGEIQLSDRQKQLLEARRRAKETSLQTSQLKGSNYNGGAKRDPTPRMNNNPHSWSDEHTVPTTWTDSSSSANSAVSRSHSSVSASMSQASASVSQASASSRTNPARQFYGQGLSGDAKRLYDDSGESYHGSRSEVGFTTSSSNDQSSQEPVMLARRVNRSKKAKGKAEDPSSLSSDDQQKAFLRKMMKSYTSKSKSKDDSSVEFSVDEASKKKNWINKSKAASSASSGSSSTSHDRAIMRKVLERARNKKLALANPRKQGLLKQSSSRMKKLLSPKSDKSSPREKSIGSPRSDTSGVSGSNQDSKKFGFGSVMKKKASRSPRFSSRNAKARLYNMNDSIIPVDQANSDVGSPRKSLDMQLQDSDTHSHSSAPKMLFDDSGASIPVPNSNSADSIHSKPGNIDIRQQETDISAISGRYSHDSTESGHLFQARSGIDSIPEVTDEGEVEIKLSHSGSVVDETKYYGDVVDDTPEVFIPEPEGYRDFMHTLKAEVAGSHTQLWESFHSVFKGNRKTRPLQQGNGAKPFDDKTKLAVASMSTYLKNEYGAESEAGTQLANDKAVKSSTSFGQHVLNRTGVARYGALCVAPTVEEEPATSKFDDALSMDRDGHGGEKAVQEALMMSDTESEVSSYAANADASSSAAGLSYAESDYISEAGSMASSTYSRSQSKMLVASRGYSATQDAKKGGRVSPKTLPSDKSTEAPVEEVQKVVAKKDAAPQIPEGNSTETSPRNFSSGAAGKTAPRDNIETKTSSLKSEVSTNSKDESNGVPSWKAKAIANAKKAKSEPPSDNNSDSGASWVGMKLRSVPPTTNTNEAKSSPMASNLSAALIKGVATPASSTTSSIPSSWAKIKLRKVVSQEEEPKKSGEESKKSEAQSNDSIHHFVVRKPKTPPASAVPPANAVENKKVEEPKTSSEAVPVQEPSGVKVPINSSPSIDKPADLPTKSRNEDSDTKETDSSDSTDSSSHGTVSVPLAPGPESKSFFGLKVVVGEKGIMKIDCPPNQQKATVIWRLEISDLKSAMLDMSAYKVKLLQTNGEHKDLSFETSEQCMKFANAFHEVANGGDDGSDDEDSVAQSDGSVFVEQLSEEEQKVLEEFRKKKRLSSEPSEVKPMDAPTEVSNAPVAPVLPKPAIGGMSFLDQIKALPTQGSDASDDKKEATSTSKSETNLNEEEQKLVESYKKMLKLRIPMEAVKHKMEKDQVDPKLMNLVLGEEGASSSSFSQSPPPSNGLTGAEQAVAAPYQRMLKMMVPAEGVRHKMEKDGVDAKIILAVLGGSETQSASASIAPKSASQLSEKDEEIAAPYRKMLKLMMPKEAVEHKLRKDGVPAHIMASVLGVDVSIIEGGKKEATKLTDEEESIASSFRKMLTLKISKEAIRRKMETEGISEKIMVAVLGESFMKGAKRGQNTPQKRIKGGFHWSPLTSGDTLRKSIWNKATLTEIAESDVASDISKHLEFFQKKEDKAGASKAIVKKDGTESKSMAKLIDLNRANNVAITLKAFNDVSQQELAQIIEFVDPHGKITGDRALFMRDLLPASAEIKVIQNYTGDESRLVPAEIWFKQIAHINRIEEKIQVMRTMETFKLEVLALADSFQILIDVCNQVMNSDKLPDILEMVRQIGNRMNKGRGEEAAGFKLDFLSRLSQTKGSDKKTTALDLVVMIFLARNQRAALGLMSDFPKCQEASKLQISELNSDVRRLGVALQKCKKEKELMRKDGHIPKWGKLPTTEDDGYNMVSAVNKIDEFVKQATSGFDQLKQVSEEAMKTCKELSEFFCETGGDKATSGLLAVLAEFAENLDQAVKKQEEQEKRREARLKNAQLKKAQPSTISPKQGQPHARSPTNSVVSNASVVSNVSGASEDSIGGKSLVLMVNQMLKMVGEKAKEDFAKGITYENPDSRLKQIYERENRRDIVGKIESRRQTSEHDAQTGLSELVKRIESRSKSKGVRMENATALVQKIRNSSESDSSRRASRDSIGSVSSRDSRDDAGVRRTSVADRWTQKIDEDQVSESGGSATLSSFSATSADMRMQSRHRQQIINRWTSKHEIVEASSKDLDEESDIGFDNTAMSRTRQRYLDRWASKQKEEHE